MVVKIKMRSEIFLHPLGCQDVNIVNSVEIENLLIFEPNPTKINEKLCDADRPSTRHLHVLSYINKWS
jgi:hypothetical protein